VWENVKGVLWIEAESCWVDSTKSSVGGSSSSCSTNGKDTDALSADDRMSYQGVEGVLALRYCEGAIAVETPGKRSQATTVSQYDSG
jgi:hypothetical protein